MSQSVDIDDSNFDQGVLSAGEVSIGGLLESLA